MGYIATGVPRLDFILGGGLPECYLVTVSGTPGTGKTVLIQQIAAHYARGGGKVLYVTGLSEGHVSIVANLRAFSFLDPDLLGDRIKLVNVLPIARGGLGGVTSAIIRTISDEKVSFVVFDGFRSLRDISNDERAVRSFLYELAATLTSIKTTAILIGEQPAEAWIDAPELLVADGVINMAARWTGQRVERTIEVVKMRGVRAVRGPHAIQISDDGMAVFPRAESVYRPPEPARSDQRALTGMPQLDRLLHGGLPRGSSTILAGHTGTGKTLLGLNFIAAGIADGEPGVVASLVETGPELLARAREAGLNWAGDAGAAAPTLLHYPQADLDPDRLAWELWEATERVNARRVVIDGLLPLLGIVGPGRVAGYLTAVLGQLRALGATVLVTIEVTDSRLPAGDVPPSVAASVDNIILLGPVVEGDLVRYRMAVTKMRGSDHDRSFHGYTIGDRGITLLG